MEHTLYIMLSELHQKVDAINAKTDNLIEAMEIILGTEQQKEETQSKPTIRPRVKEE